MSSVMHLISLSSITLDDIKKVIAQFSGMGKIKDATEIQVSKIVSLPSKRKLNQMTTGDNELNLTNLENNENVIKRANKFMKLEPNVIMNAQTNDLYNLDKKLQPPAPPVIQQFPKEITDVMQSEIDKIKNTLQYSYNVQNNQKQLFETFIKDLLQVLKQNEANRNNIRPTNVNEEYNVVLADFSRALKAIDFKKWEEFMKRQNEPPVAVITSFINGLSVELNKINDKMDKLQFQNYLPAIDEQTGIMRKILEKMDNNRVAIEFQRMINSVDRIESQGQPLTRDEVLAILAEFRRDNTRSDITTNSISLSKYEQYVTNNNANLIANNTVLNSILAATLDLKTELGKSQANYITPDINRMIQKMEELFARKLTVDSNNVNDIIKTTLDNFNQLFASCKQYIDQKPFDPPAPNTPLVIQNVQNFDDLKALLAESKKINDSMSILSSQLAIAQSENSQMNASIEDSNKLMIASANQVNDTASFKISNNKLEELKALVTASNATEKSDAAVNSLVPYINDINANTSTIDQNIRLLLQNQDQKVNKIVEQSMSKLDLAISRRIEKTITQLSQSNLTTIERVLKQSTEAVISSTKNYMKTIEVRQSELVDSRMAVTRELQSINQAIQARLDQSFGNWTIDDYIKALKEQMSKIPDTILQTEAATLASDLKTMLPAYTFELGQKVNILVESLVSENRAMMAQFGGEVRNYQRELDARRKLELSEILDSNYRSTLQANQPLVSKDDIVSIQQGLQTLGEIVADKNENSITNIIQNVQNNHIAQQVFQQLVNQQVDTAIGIPQMNPEVPSTMALQGPHTNVLNVNGDAVIRANNNADQTLISVNPRAALPVAETSKLFPIAGLQNTSTFARALPGKMIQYPERLSITGSEYDVPDELSRSEGNAIEAPPQQLSIEAPPNVPEGTVQTNVSTGQVVGLPSEQIANGPNPLQNSATIDQDLIIEYAKEWQNKVRLYSDEGVVDKYDSLARRFNWIENCSNAMIIKANENGVNEPTKRMLENIMNYKFKKWYMSLSKSDRENMTIRAQQSASKEVSEVAKAVEILQGNVDKIGEPSRIVTQSEDPKNIYDPKPVGMGYRIALMLATEASRFSSIQLNAAGKYFEMVDKNVPDVDGEIARNTDPSLNDEQRDLLNENSENAEITDQAETTIGLQFKNKAYADEKELRSDLKEIYEEKMYPMKKLLRPKMDVNRQMQRDLARIRPEINVTKIDEKDLAPTRMELLDQAVPEAATGYGFKKGQKMICEHCGNSDDKPFHMTSDNSVVHKECLDQKKMTPKRKMLPKGRGEDITSDSSNKKLKKMYQDDQDARNYEKIASKEWLNSWELFESSLSDHLNIDRVLDACLNGYYLTNVSSNDKMFDAFIFLIGYISTKIDVHAKIPKMLVFNCEMAATELLLHYKPKSIYKKMPINLHNFDELKSHIKNHMGILYYLTFQK